MICASGGFLHSADAGLCDDALDGAAVWVAELGGDEVCDGLRLLHGACFERLTDAAEATVDGGADADFWINCGNHGSSVIESLSGVLAQIVWVI